MRNRKIYWDSILSAIFVMGWFVFAFQIIFAFSDSFAAERFSWTLLLTVLTGIIGGVVILLKGTNSMQKLKYTFVYNFLGTLNMMVGIFGMLYSQDPGRPTPYLVTASLTIGIVMYKTIYAGGRIREQRHSVR